MVHIVVGGQYGSEAKAKAVLALAQMSPNTVAVGIRCGGINAGHTVYLNGNRYVLRTIPALVAHPGARLIIAAGAMINVKLLVKEINEIEAMGIMVKHRLFIDPNVSIIEDSYANMESALNLGARIGSTQTGTGIATSERVLRRASLLRDLMHGESSGVNRFHECIMDTHRMIDRYINTSQCNVFVEGTQGYGLDPFHSGHYPFCTSRSTIASAFAAEAGIPPTNITDVDMVIRTYPIRVGGNSGPIEREITWEEIRTRCGAPDPLDEITSVTKRLRRVGEFDWTMLARATDINRPTSIVIHGMDYLQWSNRGKRRISDLTEDSQKFINDVRLFTGVPVVMAFTGPLQEDVAYH